MAHARRSTYLSIIRLGLPILVSQLGMIVVGFADNIMVGNYSTPAFSSASFVNNIFNVVILACMGFTYGLTPLVGALFGRGKKRDIGSLMRNGLSLNLIFSATVTLAMGILYFFLDRLGQPEVLLPIIRPYYLIYLAGIIPIAVFNVFAQWSYAITNSAMPMWIVLGSNVFNIIGNWLLIYGHCGFPEMGLTGAGIATLLARLLCAVVIMAIFFRGPGYREYQEGFRGARVSRATMGQVWRTSIPVSGQMAFETASFSMSAVMAGWLGVVPLAAFQIIVIVGTLGFCVYYSVSSSTAVFVANRSGDPRAMRHVAMCGYHVMLLLMVAASLTFLTAGSNLMALFSDDPQVINAATTLIFPLILYQLGDATQMNFAGALRGTGHVMPMLGISFFTYIIFGIPITWLLGFPCGLGLYGIVLAFSPILFMAAGLFLYCFLRHTRPTVT